jgi:hypothetical protein
MKLTGNKLFAISLSFHFFQIERDRTNLNSWFMCIQPISSSVFASNLRAHRAGYTLVQQSGKFEFKEERELPLHVELRLFAFLVVNIMITSTQGSELWLSSCK